MKRIAKALVFFNRRASKSKFLSVSVVVWALLTGLVLVVTSAVANAAEQEENISAFLEHMPKEGTKNLQGILSAINTTRESPVRTEVSEEAPGGRTAVFKAKAFILRNKYFFFKGSGRVVLPCSTLDVLFSRDLFDKSKGQQPTAQDTVKTAVTIRIGKNVIEISASEEAHMFLTDVRGGGLDPGRGLLYDVLVLQKGIQVAEGEISIPKMQEGKAIGSDVFSVGKDAFIEPAEKPGLLVFRNIAHRWVSQADTKTEAPTRTPPAPGGSPAAGPPAPDESKPSAVAEVQPVDKAEVNDTRVEVTPLGRVTNNYRTPPGYSISFDLRGEPSLFNPGAEHMFIRPETKFMDAVYDSNAEYPLVLKLMKGRGHVYLCGRGKVTTATGKVYEFGKEDTFASRLESLKSENTLVRQGSALALGWLARSEEEKNTAVTALMGVLKDPVPEVRRNAAESLGRLKATKSLESLLALTKTYQENDSRVRLMAEMAIKRIKGELKD